MSSLSACSFKRIYNNLDFLIVEYVEGIVTLDEQLVSRLDQRATALLTWHRQTQLDEYVTLLRSVQDDFSTEVTEQQLEAHVMTIERLWSALEAQLDDGMVELLPLLDVEQRVELFSSLDGKNKKYRRDHVDIDNEERREATIETVTETYQDWMGDLTADQIDIIETSVAAIRSTAAGRLKARRAWQNRIRSILQRGESREQMKAELRQFFAEFDSNRTADVEQDYLHNRRLLIELTARVMQSSTPEQAAYFIEQSDEYIDLFIELRQQP